MTSASTRPPSDPVCVVRIIARLNVGGPSIQAITLTRELEPRGYHTVLVRGREDPDEGNMDYLAEELGVRPVLVSSMRRNPGWRDALALASLVRLMRRERPRIVHTHAAKGGTLGRLSVLIAFPRKRTRPLLIHTFHGHSLTGYFSPRTAEVFRRIERFLARRTDRLVTVSEEVRDEVVALGVAPSDRFSVVPLGFDLSGFAVNGSDGERARQALRSELGIPSDARVVTLIARLVPIKRVDRFLRVARALRDLPDVRFLIVGDGELRAPLQRSAEARDLADQLIWAGFRRDMPAVYLASDVVVQTSDNEGTPVSLIEAQAAGVPVVTTRVGGTESVIADIESGFLADREDEIKLAADTRALLTDLDLASATGDIGQRHVLERFGLPRLVDRIDDLYRELLAARRS